MENKPRKQYTVCYLTYRMHNENAATEENITNNELNQILASKQGAGLTIDGSALSVNVAELEGQDAALTRAVAEGLYVVYVIGWYPVSQNANRDTNENLTTRSFKSHLWGELLGCDERTTLVYWVDCWQFCHKSRNARMHYNEITKFVGTSITTQWLCADLLAINIAIAERICVRTITWVMNGMGENNRLLHISFHIPVDSSKW